MKLSEQLRDASAKATGGEWEAEPETGRRAWIKGANDEWASLALGDSDESASANARLIALMCSETNREYIAKAVEAYERGPTPEQVREAGNAIKDALQLGPTPRETLDNAVHAAIRALDMSKIGGE